MYFSYFGGSKGIFGLFEVLGSFGYFRGIGGIMIVFWVLKGAFWWFYEYFGHLECILVILVVPMVFWSFKRFWGAL